MSGESGLRARAATPSDVAAITRIYNQGIAEGTATFETRLREDEHVMAWFGTRFPVVVVESSGEVIAFASTSEYRARECYAGIAEFSVYVDRAHRGRGAGRIAMETLSMAARAAGFGKLVSRVFIENLASRALLRDLGFREVGIYERHARLGDAWKDVVIVEKLLEVEL
jgi:phosphinothricin acetyltransferase